MRQIDRHTDFLDSNTNHLGNQTNYRQPARKFLPPNGMGKYLLTPSRKPNKLFKHLQMGSLGSQAHNLDT